MRELASEMASEWERVYGAASEAANGAQQVPPLVVNIQYIKDLSFENPNAPNSLGPQEKAPDITIQVNVNARQLSLYLENLGRFARGERLRNVVERDLKKLKYARRVVTSSDKTATNF